ncbi:hypothetical protein L7G72_14215 [Xenorhabdus bovienii]|uniref:hypothetical protein n=1 Tax=Xenorhabdus bovienii TaxID=40576 RepID=UPI001EE05287|nr:hypothetical protein [Xenorhabdus bovienii]MCG3462980.1 hypothetical protein [Xenorhabdus bovienii]
MLISALVVARAFNPFPKIDDLEAPLVAAVGVLLFIRHLTKLGVSQYFNFINGLHTLRVGGAVRVGCLAMEGLSIIKLSILNCAFLHSYRGSHR